MTYQNKSTQATLMTKLPEEIFDSVERDVRLYENYLKKIATQVVQTEISSYPIFIAHREPRLQIGRPIIVADAMRTDWSINASLLEEFSQKKLIAINRIANFKEIYKSPKKYICLFIISGTNEASFAFYPYHEEK